MSELNNTKSRKVTGCLTIPSVLLYMPKHTHTPLFMEDGHVHGQQKANQHEVYAKQQNNWQTVNLCWWKDQISRLSESVNEWGNIEMKCKLPSATVLSLAHWSVCVNAVIVLKRCAHTHTHTQEIIMRTVWIEKLEQRNRPHSDSHSALVLK